MDKRYSLQVTAEDFHRIIDALGQHIDGYEEILSATVPGKHDSIITGCERQIRLSKELKASLNSQVSLVE